MKPNSNWENGPQPHMADVSDLVEEFRI